MSIRTLSLLAAALALQACSVAAPSGEAEVSAPPPAAPVPAAPAQPAPAPMPQEWTADGAVDALGRLALDLGGTTVAVEAACSSETTSLQRCATATVRVEVPGAAPRTVAVETLMVNARATAYRGPLDDAGDRAGRSIVLSDVNADGVEDLALWTGTLGANGAASYDVFLAEPEAFRESPALSRLTEGANGLFTVESGALVRTSKSGCCIHTTERFELQDGQPLLVESVTEDSTENRETPKVTVQRRVDGRMRDVET